MHPKLGFSLQKQYDRPLAEVIPLLKAAGFFAVSPIWTTQEDLDALASYVKNQGMIIQSLHAPHKGIALLWQPDDPDCAPVLQEILRSIDGCRSYGIPILVVHPWQGLFYTFPDTPLNFTCFDRIVSYAEDQNVSIAFENLEGEEYLSALMNRYYNRSHVGFCWDCGHDHCYPHKTDFVKAYGNRLIMTHFNDNFGLRDPGGIPSGFDDLHFLPGDGNSDWDAIIQRASCMPRQEILNFELKTLSHSTNKEDLIYKDIPLKEFIERAAKLARCIGEKYAAATK